MAYILLAPRCLAHASVGYIYLVGQVWGNVICIMVGQVWQSVSTMHMYVNIVTCNYVNTATCNDGGGGMWGPFDQKQYIIKRYDPRNRSSYSPILKMMLTKPELHSTTYPADWWTIGVPSILVTRVSHCRYNITLFHDITMGHNDHVTITDQSDVISPSAEHSTHQWP